MILPTILLIMLLLTFIGLTLSTVAITQLRSTSRAVSAANSLLVAESGVEKSLNKLNEDTGFTGYASQQELFNNQKQGRGTYQVTIENGSISNEKIVTSVGRVYVPADAAEPTVIRRVRVIVVGTTSSGYAVQTGPGGLIMANAATVANGKVHVDGKLTMSNSASIGTLLSPTELTVAHKACPEPATASYPEVCSSGQPISITNIARIWGTVCATNQTNGSGMSSPGLTPGCTAPPVPLPDYDRQAHINAVTNTMSGSTASCSGIQSKTWPADTHITGNVTLSNACQVTINGKVWIDGRLTISNAARLIVGSGVSAQPTIMVDGSSGFSAQNAGVILPNLNGIGVQIITFHSAAACSPNCTDVTGIDLYNSKDVTTINISNAGLAAGSTFYARWSKAILSNAGSIGAVGGQTVQLNNSGAISFGTELSSGQNVWTIKNYQLVFE